MSLFHCLPFHSRALWQSTVSCNTVIVLLLDLPVLQQNKIKFIMAPCQASVGKNSPIIQELYALFERGELPLKDGMQLHEYRLNNLEKFAQYDVPKFRAAYHNAKKLWEAKTPPLKVGMWPPQLSTSHGWLLCVFLTYFSSTRATSSPCLHPCAKKSCHMSPATIRWPHPKLLHQKRWWWWLSLHWRDPATQQWISLWVDCWCWWWFWQ